MGANCGGLQESFARTCSTDDKGGGLEASNRECACSCPSTDPGEELCGSPYAIEIFVTRAVKSHPFSGPDGFQSVVDFCTSRTGLSPAASAVPFAAMSGVRLSRSRLFSANRSCPLEDVYKLHDILAAGNVGTAYFATANHAFFESNAGAAVAMPQISETPRNVVVKIFGLRDEAATAKIRAIREASFKVETQMLAQLEHPNIVRMFECMREDDRLCIVLEHCSGGELYEKVVERAPKGGFKEFEVCKLLLQMLCAVSYLHCRRVLHRDIKPENFLLLGAEGSPEANIVKLCDFGSAVQLRPGECRAMDSTGTLSYTAPEIYLGRGACQLSDVWSLGVVFYVMLVGANPFRWVAAEPAEETCNRIEHGNFNTSHKAWREVSAQARDLVEKLLTVEESQRLSSTQALQHPWVTLGRPDFLQGRDKNCLLASQVVGLLERFEQLDVLQKLLLVACARFIPEVEILHQDQVPWYDLFIFLDADGDGQLSIQEFVDGLCTLAGASTINVPRLENTLRALDVDGSSAIEWAEWVSLALLSTRGLADREEPLRTAFRSLDTPTRDGIICSRDLAHLFGEGFDAVGFEALSFEDVRQLFQSVHWGIDTIDLDASAEILGMPLGSESAHMATMIFL